MIRGEDLITILDMKVGDKVRIKSYDEIKKTLDIYGECNNGSKEQKSLCLALIRQVMSGNPVNLKIFTDLEEGITCFSVESAGGFNYTDFLEDHWSGFVAYNIPDWPCLKLKPEILEKAIINCLKQHNREYLKQVLHKTLEYWFVFHATEDSDYWLIVNDELKNFKQNSIESTYEHPLKIQKNEIEFQRKKASVIRGDLPEGSEQRSGKSKASVVCGHLCYNICSGGQED